MCAVPAGVVAGAATVFVAGSADYHFAQQTGIKIGNAAVTEDIYRNCADTPAACEAAWARKTSTKLWAGVGAPISTGFFAFGHNISFNGVDFRTFPAFGIVAGMSFWMLQRRLGILSNVTAHATMNWISLLVSMRAGR